MRARAGRLAIIVVALWTLAAVSPPGLALAAPGPLLPPGASSGSFRILYDVSATSERDAWAVGYQEVGTEARTLITHWDGTSWVDVPNPNPGPNGGGVDYLFGVSAISATDAWAVGEFENQDRKFVSLTEHWNGTRWSFVHSRNPSIATGLVVLNSVSAASADDVWAVGDYSAKGRFYKTLVEHWDGTKWHRVKSADPPKRGTAQLTAVDAISATDVWAVGDANHDQTNQDLVEHWDGHTWALVASDDQGGRETYNALTGVGAVSGTDIWSVGRFSNAAGSSRTFTERWNGTAWTRVESVDAHGGGNALQGVSVVAAADVWAVGSHGTQEQQTLIEHWDGSRWRRVASPAPVGSYLLGVSLDSRADGWAVGADRTSGAAIFEHWNGTAWSQVAGPSPLSG